MQNSLKYILLCTGTLIATVASAIPPPPPESVPIDGGLSYLVAAGLVYGGKKAYQKRKSEDK